MHRTKAGMDVARSHTECSCEVTGEEDRMLRMGGGTDVPTHILNIHIRLRGKRETSAQDKSGH